MIGRSSRADLGQVAQEATDDIRAAAGRVSEASGAAVLAFSLVSIVAVAALVFAVLAYRRAEV
jgi:hypothetical protein